MCSKPYVSQWKHELVRFTPLETVYSKGLQNEVPGQSCVLRLFHSDDTALNDQVYVRHVCERRPLDSAGCVISPEYFNPVSLNFLFMLAAFFSSAAWIRKRACHVTKAQGVLTPGA